MSALPGADVNAVVSTGQAATANTVETEPGIEIQEAPSVQNQEVAHTGISLGMDVISKQYIYTNTVDWHTSDPPGKLVLAVPIHPSTCNEYTAHFYKAFSVWVGGMKVRARVIGTAFYGGGLYFTRIPPSFTIEEIEAMTLSTITAFPHRDLDPKNLVPLELDLPDYRTTHFHHGNLDYTSSASFGGWLAIFVNARLVTQSAEMQTVQIRIERAGDFQFNIPGPISQAVSQATGPISPEGLYIPDLIGCDDASAVGGGSSLIVLPATEKRFHTGNFFMQKAGGEWTYNPGINANLNLRTGQNLPAWEQIVKEARRKFMSHEIVYDASASLPYWSRGLHFNLKRFSVIGGNQTVWHPCDWTPINVRIKDPGTFISVGNEQTGTVVSISDLSLGTLPGDLVWNCPELSDTGVCHLNIYTMDGSGLPSPGLLNDYKSILLPSLDDAAIGFDSYVGLETNYSNTLSAQAKSWSHSLSTFTSWPVGNAALYVVKNRIGIAVMYLKFRSNGHAYTNAHPSGSIRVPGVRLEFVQWIPESDPVPVAPTFAALALKSSIEAATTKVEKKAMKQFALELQKMRLQVAQAAGPVEQQGAPASSS